MGRKKSKGLNPDRGCAIFSDGSAWTKDKSGGWAYVIIDSYGSQKVGSGYVPDTTNNRMELQAVIEGLNYLSGSLGSCDVLVYSDSEIVVKGYNGQYERRHNTDLWKDLDIAVGQHSYVELIWVKGHKDSLYNHMADGLAKEARKNGNKTRT